MNVIEALKSGKRFRHVSGNGWIDPNQIREICLVMNDLPEELRCPLAIFISDHFEIEEEKIEVTADQIKNALGRTWDVYVFPVAYANLISFGNTLLKELGFKK